MPKHSKSSRRRSTRRSSMHRIFNLFRTRNFGTFGQSSIRCWTMELTDSKAFNPIDNFIFNVFSEKAGDRINFVSMLEEIRQIVVYDSDKANLTKTANYILETIVRSEDLLPKVSQMLVELFERYANFVLNPKYTPQTSALFPPYGEYSDLEEQKIKDTANYLLARYAVQTSDFSKASDYVAKISEAGLTKEGVKELMEKVSQFSCMCYFTFYQNKINCRFNNEIRRMLRRTVLMVSRWLTRFDLKLLRKALLMIHL